MSTDTLIVETETMIATPEPAIIELKDVEVTFTSRTGSLFKPHKVHAVRGVSMRIERGLTLGIVGESGCGKSTTANVMCGLQMPTKGKVFFGGKEVTKRSAAARREIGRVVSVVFQDPATALNPRMHVADQLADPLRVHGIGDEASRAKRVQELISLVGLPSRTRCRASCRAASVSAWPSPEHCRSAPTRSSPMSRQARSTCRCAPKS